MKKILLLLVYMLCFSVSSSLAQNYSMLIKGGHVIDPKNNIDGIMDVAIKGDTIVAVSKNIDEKLAKRVVDAKGLYVTPGIIDMHVHAFYGTDTNSYIANAETSLPPDAFSFRAGVTTVVDAGSSGWRNFRQFKEQTIDRSRTRVLAFLNIVGAGMVSRFREQNVDDMNPEMVALMIKRLYPDIIVGIKAAHYWGDFTQVDRAVEAGKMANVPVMVDFGEHDPPNSIKSLFLDHLRPGDIFTHTYSYTQGREAVVDENFKVKPFVFEAQKKGLIFDVGHGGGSFIWWQVIPSIQQGFLPNTISTDLHTDSMNGGMKNMANVMSKLLNAGMSIEDVILRSTWNPAKVIQRRDLGNLSVGTVADVTVFKLLKGDFGFIDTRHRKLMGTKKLQAELTVRAGRVVWDLNGISVPMWNTEPRQY